MSPRVAQLMEAVEMMHKCTARAVESSLVMGLTGHPHARRCYVWSYVEKGEPQYVTVLERPPVDSAKTAVHAAIVAGGK